MCLKNQYRVKVIKRNGVACVSILSDDNVYTDNHKEPKGLISRVYTDKPYKRYRIINKIKGNPNERENSMVEPIND